MILAIQTIQGDMMDDAEYTQTQQQLLCLAGIIKDMPLREFIDKINRCESIAPLINPTLYMEGGENLSIIKKIAQGAQNFQAAIAEVQPSSTSVVPTSSSSEQAK